MSVKAFIRTNQKLKCFSFQSSSMKELEDKSVHPLKKMGLKAMHALTQKTWI